MSDERPESDIRKRAAWLLAMLAVVAGLFVLLSVTLFHTSGGGGSTSTGAIADAPTDLPSTGSNAGSGTPSAPASSSVSGPSSVSGSTGSGSSSAPASATTSAPVSSASSGPVPTASCPGSTTCAVQGDVTGAMNAINAYRAQKGKQAVPTTRTAAADTCALTSGSDCPSSFVWVHVDDLSGAGVVKGVTGFNSNDDLLANTATSFAVGWAYDPGSKSISCALIRNS